MSIPFTEPKIANIGELERERVVFTATEDVELTSFAVFCCRVGPSGNPRGGPVKAFWLSNKEIKKGDFVVLYSKTGKPSEKVQEDGPSSHFFYWRSVEPIWTKETIPVIIEITTWTYPPPLPQESDEPAA